MKPIPSHTSKAFNFAGWTTLLIACFGFSNLVTHAQELSEKDQKAKMRAVLEIKKFEDAPAAQADEIIDTEMKHFMQSDKEGAWWLINVVLPKYQANPQSLHEQYPDIFTKKDESPSIVSTVPEKIDAKMKFIGDLAEFPSDSEWKVIEASNVGKNLTSDSPLVHGITTEGKYVVVAYTVKNLTGKSRTLNQSPMLVDGSGSTYQALPLHEYWVKRLGNVTIELEQLPNKVAKKFAAIYEMPDENSVVCLVAHELGGVTKAEQKIVLVPRPKESEMTLKSEANETKKLSDQP